MASQQQQAPVAASPPRVPVPIQPNVYPKWRTRLSAFAAPLVRLFVSRKENPVASYSDRGVAQAMRYLYIRIKRLGVTRVYTGSDRAGVYAFTSYYSGVGDKESKGKAQPISQFTVSSKVAVNFNLAPRIVPGRGQRLADLQQLLVIDEAYAPFDPDNAKRVEKANIGHLVYRWANRANYWDETARQTKPRDAAQRARENLSVENFVKDLLVTDPAYNPVCARMPLGFECSHLAESCHNPVDWARLEHNLCSLTVITPAKGATTEASTLADYKQWIPGYKVELSRFEPSELNRSRMACATFQWHWCEQDCSPINPVPDTRRVVRVERYRGTGVSEVVVPDGWPTVCPHSCIVDEYTRLPVPCYGLRPTGVLPAATGMTPSRMAGGTSAGAQLASPEAGPSYVLPQPAPPREPQAGPEEGISRKRKPSQKK